jgi:L-lactate utilization protein LutC
MAPKKEAKKGKQILFVAGKYDGKKGWIDLGQDEMRKMVGVIVEGKRPGDEVIVTKVFQSSVKEVGVRKNPESYEEALLDQHLDIEALIEKLAKELARCEITGKGGSADEIVSALKKKITKAHYNQSLLGHDARWRKVKFRRASQQTVQQTVAHANEDESIDLADEENEDESM